MTSKVLQAAGSAIAPRATQVTDAHGVLGPNVPMLVEGSDPAAPYADVLSYAVSANFQRDLF